MKAQTVHSVNLVGQGAIKVFKPKAKKFKKKGFDKAKQITNDGKKVDKCHFCRKEGHYQKDCLKCKA